MAAQSWTISTASAAIGRGELTPSELLKHCLERIDRYESQVHAWVYLDRDGASQQAEALTQELKSGKNRGALHGIPIGVKDIIDVFDMPTGCGSRLWANSYARRDATCVERLRQAGAVILGKTVTTAYASFDPSITRNPWNLERTPGGSSSGSAAAVACEMCLGALGTQTGGSLTRPASYCGVCSLKPSHRRVSVDGVLPLAPKLDHVGVMANCVHDLAILFQAIAGADERIGFTFQGHTPVPDCDSAVARGRVNSWEPDLVCFTSGQFLRPLDQAVRPKYSRLIEKLETQVSFLEKANPPVGFVDILSHHRVVMAVEAAAYHGTRFRRHPEDYPPRITELIEDGQRYSGVELNLAYQAQRDLKDQCDRTLNGLRHLLMPATADSAPGIAGTGDPVFNSPWSFTGLPTISMPFDWSDDGLPLAIQLVGSSMCEDDLFETASWLENRLEFLHRELPL